MIPQLLTASFMLVLVSFLDLRYREVQDKIWIPFGILGVFFILLDALQNEFFSPILILASIGLTGGIAFGTYYLGFYGGADAKALFTLAIILPLFPTTTSFHPFTGLATLSNSLLLSLSVPAFMFARNILQVVRGKGIFLGFEGESSLSKIAVMFLGYRTRVAEGFLFRLEREENGIRKFDFSVNKVDEDYAQGSDIWVTPGLPLLVFITIGFFLLFIAGDLVFLLVSIFLNGFR